MGGYTTSGTNSYHNGGVEGDGLSSWYDNNLAGEYSVIADGVSGSSSGSGGSKGSGSGGSKGSGSGGSKGSGSGGSKGSGSGGSKGSGSGGSKGSGSGGSKGSGSGGSKGSGSGGSKGSGSGGSKGSGSGGSKGSGSGGGGVPCFCRGTRIKTSAGWVRVENLTPGCLVLSGDGSYKKLRTCLQTKVSKAEMAWNPKLRPVRIISGALGAGLPLRDLLVSRQHRMLVSSPIAKRMFDHREVLLSAIKLTGLPGIFVDHDVVSTAYFHLVFDDHELIWAEGALSESFHTGAQALEALDDAAREEVFTLFPDLANGTGDRKTACFVPDNRQQKKLVARHLINGKSLYDPLP